MNTHDIAIVVPSCDTYSDMWPIFFSLFKKNYPDCPFKIYLITNHEKPFFEGVEVLSVGEDISWSGNFLKALSSVQESRVLLWVDDLFLMKKVNTGSLNAIIESVVERDIEYVCLNGVPKPNKRIDSYIGLINSGVLYRVSAVLSLWKKERLVSILKPTESAWQFELEGSIRSDRYQDFASVYVRPFAILNSVIKGKWRRLAVHRLQKQGIAIDIKRRQKFSVFREFVFMLKQFRTFVFNLLPSQYRRFIRSVFKK